MDLSRRDALAALAATGVAVGGSTLLAGDDGDAAPDSDASRDDDATPDDDAPTDASLPDDAVETLAAVARVLYPTEATGVDAFVETYLDGRLSDDPGHREGVREAAGELDATARDWFDAPLVDLDRSTRDRLLRELGVDTADPDPDGNLSDRVRFFVVNELLYAFYASPAGGRLVGVENPVGYPGGTESYRSARMEDDADG